MAPLPGAPKDGKDMKGDKTVKNKADPKSKADPVVQVKDATSERSERFASEEEITLRVPPFDAAAPAPIQRRVECV